MVTTDVLSYLSTNDRLNRNPFTARHGEIVLASGTIFFADKSMIELGMNAFQSSLNKTSRDKASQEVIKLMKGFFDKSAVPSAFILVNDDEEVVSGTLRDEGMQEPISVYYYKHGSEGLDDVHVIGIKEARSRVRETEPPSGALMQISRPTAASLYNVILPSEGVRVTPIAIFRKIL